MTNTSIFKIITGIGLLAINVYAFIDNNEIILGSALIFLLLFLISLISVDNQANSPFEKSAVYAIRTFVIIVAFFNVFISAFLPTIANIFNLNGLYDGDFVRVMINDAHELAYFSGCLLLLMQGGYILFFRIQTKLKSISSRERSAITSTK